MWRYITKRILMLIPVILGTSLLVFCVMALAKGDAVTVMTAGQPLSTEQIEELRESLGLNRPLLVRYFDYLLDICRGDFGTSIISGEPVLKLFLSKFPATVKLALAATAVNIVLSIPLGIFSARHQGSLADNGAMVVGLVGLSMPSFWLGLMLMTVFCVNLKWLPALSTAGDFKSIILPAIALGTGMMATSTRTTRSAMLDVLRQDYLRTARAKGVPEKVVINKHALKNAMIPILTTTGTQLAKAFGGGAVIEMVFAFPGVGKLLVDAIDTRDTNLACGCIILQTTITVVVLLLVDLLYGFVDPRIKAQYAKGGKK